MRTRGVFIMTKYNSIKVEKGSGGWGGPLIITPTEQKHKFIYIVGGGENLPSSTESLNLQVWKP